MKRMNLFFILSLILLLNTNAYSEFNSLGSNSLFPVDFLNDVYIFDENTVMTVGSVGTILNTYNGGANWLNSIIDPVYDMRGIQFLNINTGWMQSNFYGQILKTTNGGSNWLNLAQTAGPFYFINENTGWTTYSNAGIEIRILKTTNGGINWTSQYNISDNYYPNSVYFGDSNTGYVLGFNNGNDSKIIKTTNSGVNWIVQPLINNSLNTFYFINSNTGWAAGRDGAILRTTNAGNNWFTQNSGTNGGLRSVEFINENTGWACGENSILKTTNGGINWEDQWNLQLMNFTSISCYGESNIWTVGNSDTALGGIVYKSLNGGINWIRVFDSNVSVNIISTNIPDYFELFQNYPNPFNPVTKIKFDIKKDEGSGTQDVKLIIYDALGKQLQVLINDKLNAGSYESEFDGSDFVSGVYFYKLEAGDFVETKRMILLK